MDREGNPFFLECNLFCSFGSKSVVNVIAKESGFTDESLFDLMVQNALLRKEKTSSSLSYRNSFSNYCYIQFLLASKRSQGSRAGENAGGGSMGKRCDTYLYYTPGAVHAYGENPRIRT